MVPLRIAVALLALGAFAALILTADRSPADPNARLVRSLWILLIPLAATATGLLRGAPWSRWLGISMGLAVLPWAMAIALEPLIPGRWRAVLSLAASAALLASLTGGAMFERFEGRSNRVDWAAPGMRLIRWTIICNGAAALALYLFVTAYDYRVDAYLAVAAALLIALLVGLALLARGRTVGLLLVGLFCLLFVPAGVFFLASEASSSGEAVLFGVAFLPGIAMAWASLVTFGPRLLRMLGASDGDRVRSGGPPASR